jgi:hypothetical protein
LEERRTATYPVEMINDDSTAFLESIVGKTLHVTIADGRLLVGQSPADNKI